MSDFTCLDERYLTARIVNTPDEGRGAVGTIW